MNPLWPRFVSLLGALTLLQNVSAQDPAAPAPPPATPAPAAPAEPDPKVLKLYEFLTTQKYTLDSAEVLSGLERAGTADPSTMTVADRFLYRFRTADWPKVREELAIAPPELAHKLYDKILADLTEKQKPNVRLEDALGLADAAPAEPTPDEVRKLGQLLAIAVPINESYWLTDSLKKGTAKLGGSDPAKRLLAGRILLAGGFKELAREYLPSAEQVEKLPDEAVRNELTSFLASERESADEQTGELQRVWEDGVRSLANPKGNEWEKTKSAQAMVGALSQMTPGTLASLFPALLKTNPDAGVHLLGGMNRKVQRDRGASDIVVRAEDLRTQASVARLLAENVDLGTQPWNQLGEMMAENWIAEAENTVAQKAANAAAQKYVPTEEILAAAPRDKWFDTVNPAMRDRLDATVCKVIIAGANFEPAAERIVELAKRRPAVGTALAEDFLSAWAKAHNPEIPEALRKKYDLPDDARIPVTPMMMEKNVASLSQMMALFRQNGLVPKDYAKVVNAFDLAYSNAETYRVGDIEKVFGPLDRMDEPVFFLILSRMSANLSERWRKIETQKAGMTRRDEAQTLELVRTGYTTALGMIESWLKGHPDGARALTLAGTLLTDWGDFEYFQELVSSDARKRTLGYKEKNMQAQEYFQRGADAYAREVPKLAPGDYSVDAYLGWFNGLLGIGSDGQLNLSKAMNRGGLAKIREHLLALPGKAAQAHLGMFAKIVNARLADEKDPLHEDLKYRYMASALAITKDDPFTLAAEKKVAYFDQLLSEVRLQTRVDGPTTVGRDQDFGIVLSVIHTEAMGRVAKFGQYLSNDPGLNGAKSRRKSLQAKKMRAAQSPREELELNISDALSPFFEIKSMTFSTPEVTARPTARPGWDETVLAYLQVRVKDASVDKIPPVGMDLKFVDLSGPITIPAESAETVIKVAENPGPRPANQIEIAETLDNRQLAINGGLALEVKATATGLVPELDELLNLDALRKAFAVRNVNPHDGLQVKEINTWGDQPAPLSERQWTISLDGDPVRAAGQPVPFYFPPPRVRSATVTYQSFRDMDPIKLSTALIEIGHPLKPGQARSGWGRYGWASALALVALGAVAGCAMAWRRRRRGTRAGEKREVFAMPRELDGFAVVALLRRLRVSACLTEAQRPQIQSDMQRVQQACFGSSAGTMSEAELRAVAEKWLRFAN